MAEPITESAVELRLRPENWPEELDPKTIGVVPLTKGIEEAVRVFGEFRQTREANRTNRHLTPEGALAVTTEWAKGKLPQLEARLAAIRERAAEVETNLTKQLAGKVAKPPQEATEIALMQETRAWLRSLPEADRMRHLDQLVRNGDRPALRAVLTAPSYLTGIEGEHLAALRDHVARIDHPERYAKLESFRKAASAAERAVEGVMTLIETGPAAAARMREAEAGLSGRCGFWGKSGASCSCDRGGVNP